ncbi:uncharacterized protein LOC132947207 [Metopolophium dirhodum]|uniref:uncharacterized protein LOC132947207 n=1 Tax=Metopolophium dirhodum TaxID=44670 RepID=UPI00298FC9BA|nr:uncharacterized protein LOC132947207 [Metopolophium dirhodum]
MDSRDQNNSMNNASKKKSSKQENSITSFKAILNQEVCFEDDNKERCLNNLSIGDLKTKVNLYNSWYLQNKINVDNAFDIDLISCVRQMVKRSKETDILLISNTFDAISKVYSCRVDDILNTGNKLVKEFVAETKNKKLVKENETKTKQKSRKKLMLTTAEKLRSKDKQMLPRKHFFNVNFDNDMIDYANPSRILMNRYSNDTYWPEYSVSKNVPKVNKNQQETYYEMENLSLLIKNGKICPSFHKFIAERDKSTNCDDDTDTHKLDNIQTHFSPETSAFCANNSEDTDDLMNVDFNKPSSEIIVHTSPGPSNQNSNGFGKLENLNSLSQALSLLDLTNSSDYTFFDRQKIRNFKCPNHWKEKFKMMKTDSKQKAMLIKSRVAQTHSETNVPENKCSNSRDIQFKVDFYLDKTTTLKNINWNSGKNQCNYNKWEQSNNLIPSSHQWNTTPIRQLENCKYINMVPNWYKHEFEELNLNTKPNTLFLFSEQDILKDRLLLDEVPVENTDYIDKNVMDTDHYSEDGNEDDEMMTEINNDDNLTIALNQQNTPDDDYEEYNPTCNSGYIDMQELKKYIMYVIKPDGERTNILLSYLIEELPKFLSENMKKNINVSVIFVALLHLCNEHSLSLQDINGDVLITQGSVNLNN